MAKTTLQNPEVPHDDTSVWYAVRLFSLRLRDVTEYFASKGMTWFVPLHYVEYEKDGRLHRELRPVVSNLVFLRVDKAPDVFKKAFAESPYKMSVLRKNNPTRDFCEIPAKEMMEFRLMCNPEIELRRFLSEDEARLKPGAPVYVKYGPLSGLSGRLVRQDKKYYLLKEVPGLGVMIKVSRWCCKPIKQEIP